MTKSELSPHPHLGPLQTAQARALSAHFFQFCLPCRREPMSPILKLLGQLTSQWSPYSKAPHLLKQALGIKTLSAPKARKLCWGNKGCEGVPGPHMLQLVSARSGGWRSEGWRRTMLLGARLTHGLMWGLTLTSGHHEGVSRGRPPPRADKK